jgi:hypothetical protein
MANNAGTNRRRILKVAGAGLLGMVGVSALGKEAPKPAAMPPANRRMKITNVETIMTGSDVFVKIETDAGIVGYGDATNHFLPYTAQGTLKDISPYLIGEDPERIEYLWQVCFRRRFMRGVLGNGGNGSSPICPFGGDCTGSGGVPDGYVSSGDVSITTNHIGLAGIWSEGDFNGNGIVADTDVSLATANNGLNQRAIYRSWQWTLDALGNWAGYTQIVDLNGNGVYTDTGDSLLQQTRVHNKVNEIHTADSHTTSPDAAAITEGSGQAAWVSPGYDAAGNTTSGPKPGSETTCHKSVYDAWNRLVKVETDATPAVLIAEYRYDGLGRRIFKIVRNVDEQQNVTYDRTDYYYNESWQCLEEQFSAGQEDKDAVATTARKEGG